MTSQSPAHVALVEDPDRVVPPSKRSLLRPCSTTGSVRSDLRDMWKTSFLYGLPLADPGPRSVVPSTLCPLEGQRRSGACRPLLAPERSF